MKIKQTVGVSEARLGLSVLTCVLLALGFLALQQLGGTGEKPRLEIRDGSTDGQIGNVDNAGKEEPTAPRVLIPQGGQAYNSGEVQTSLRPAWPPQTGGDGEKTIPPGPDPTWPILPGGLGEVPRTEQPPR